MVNLMKSKSIPLYINLSKIHLEFRLSVFQQIDGDQITEKDESLDTLGYVISGTGELSRMIEIVLNTKKESENIVESFHKVSVCLSAHRPGVKKYSGYFLYTQKDHAFKIYHNKLTLYLNIPKLTFDKFCSEISSKNIQNLLVGINLSGEQDSSVGSFGPPSVDDIISLTADDFMFDSNVRLTSLEANIQVGAHREADKDNKI